MDLRLISKSLSDNEIRNALKGKCNIVSYPKIEDYKTLDDLLGPYGCAVLLYHSKKNYGHWTCIFKYPDNKTVEFFDPYSNSPDGALNFIPMKFRKENNEYYPYLTKLLYESPYKIEYNDYPLQSHGFLAGNQINTCGRHVLMRLFNRKLNIDQYMQRLFMLGDDPDIVVTEMTEYI